MPMLFLLNGNQEIKRKADFISGLKQELKSKGEFQWKPSMKAQLKDMLKAALRTDKRKYLYSDFRQNVIS